MKVLDVDLLHDGLTRNINKMNQLEKEMTAIQQAVEKITAMEDALKGEGGQAIRNFYTSCHLPFLQYFLMFKEEFNTVLQQAQQALVSLEPVDAGHIVEEFLETRVEKGLTESAMITATLTDEANAIMDEVSDIVSLPKLNDTLVQESVMDARAKRDDTVEALHTFDSTQTNQFVPIESSIQSMKEWVQQIEGLFQEGLTDVNFPTDKWSTIASRSSLGMAMVARQSSVGSVAHALYEQNQLAMMLQASLSNMTPIQFGLGGYARKSYPTYGPIMLSFTSLSPGDSINKSVQQVSESTNSDLEALYVALAKEAKRMGLTSPLRSQTYSAQEGLTYEGMRRILGGNGPGTPDGMAPYATYAFDFLTEDLQTLVNPDATVEEKFLAMGYTFIRPVKGIDTVADVVKGAKDTGKETYQHLKDYKNNKYFTRSVEYNAGKDGTGFTYKVYQRGDINWDMVRTKGAKKGRGLTNAEASAKYGLAPILDDAGSVATLHHSQQKGVGPLYEASTRYHNISNAKRAPLHPYKGKLNRFYPMDETTRGAFQKVDSINYWKIRGEEALGGK